MKERLVVLGICGSPRNGNSLYLLQKALEGCTEAAADAVTTIYSVKGKSFHPCIACSHCAKHEGACVHMDDFEELRTLWLAADVILYSVPVYHMGIPAQLKAFIDRLGNSMFGRYRSRLPAGKDTLPRLLKVIGSIAQGIHAFSGQESTLTDLINHALVMQCVPVTGDLWESYIGAGGWTLNRGEKDAMRSLAEEAETGAVAAVNASRSVGRRAAELAMIIRAGACACRGSLGRDPVYGPLLSGLEDT